MYVTINPSRRNVLISLDNLNTLNKENVMKLVNTALFTADENVTTRENFGNKLIQTGNGNDYVYANEQVVVELKYDGVSLIDLLWQNGNDFKGGDYNRPNTKLNIYSDTEREVRIFDNWGSYADDDEKSELIDLLNEKMEKAGREERFIQDNIDFLYSLVRNNEPESPSQDVDDYLYDVNIIEWQQDENGSYPESKESKTGLSYSELRDLQCNHDVGITNVYLA